MLLNLLILIFLQGIFASVDSQDLCREINCDVRCSPIGQQIGSRYKLGFKSPARSCNVILRNFTTQEVSQNLTLHPSAEDQIDVETNTNTCEGKYLLIAQESLINI